MTNKTAKTAKTKCEITDLLVRNTKPGLKLINLKDTKVEGFTLRVYPSGTKSWALMMRDTSGDFRTFTIGRYPDLSVKDARRIAEQLRHEVRYDGVTTPTKTGKAPKDPTTLGQLIKEVQPVFAVNRKGWRPRGSSETKGNSHATILAVFKPLLNNPVETITEHDIARVVNEHKRQRPTEKKTANGQVSRAMSYLSSVLDWAAHRGRFAKIGAGRLVKLAAPSVHLVHDPSDNDPTIRGKRDRVLSVDEITAIFPLLTYPAPVALRRENIAREDDYGPVATRFLFLTLARVGEVSAARWRDFNFRNGVWTRQVKDTRGEGTMRTDELPLSKAALDLLKSLPGFAARDPDAYVFPNSSGGFQGNWDRISKAIQKASGTSDWTRHDIRRTGATLLEELEVAIQTIDAILAHTNRLGKTGASGSAGHYLTATRIMNAKENPKVIALTKLAQALEVIVEECRQQLAS